MQRYELQNARDNFTEFLFNRNLYNHEAVLEQTKIKFKETETTFAPVID